MKTHILKRITPTHRTGHALCGEYEKGDDFEDGDRQTTCWQCVKLSRGIESPATHESTTITDPVTGEIIYSGEELTLREMEVIIIAWEFQKETLAPLHKNMISIHWAAALPVPFLTLIGLYTATAWIMEALR